jgi:Flp pilus assembly protein TadD
MPSRTYMVVDPRRDHSLRVPRPDLALELGTPDACTGCHADRTPQWAAEAAAGWWPGGRRAEPHWGRVLAAARRSEPGSGAAAARLVADPGLPGIVRATAAALLQAVPAADSGAALRAALSDSDPLVRLGGLYGADALPPPERLRLAAPALDDPVRTLRVEAARVAAPLRQLMLEPQRERLAAAVGEFREAQHANADRAEAWLNLGVLSLQLGDAERARGEYAQGLEIDAGFVPLWANLADLHRGQGDDAEAERVLRAGLERAESNPELRHALGLTLVRRKRLEAALLELEAAARERPSRSDFAYVYGIALESAGQPEQAF